MSEKIRLSSQTPARLPDADRYDAVRFCPKCGREISPDRSVCIFCANTGAVPRPVHSRKQKLLVFGIVLCVMLFLLLALDLVIRIAGPLPEAVPTITPETGIQGTSVPVILLP